MALLLAAFSAGAQAQLPPPAVLQQIQVPVDRARVVVCPDPVPDPVSVRYILIDPGNAILSRDGFAPQERVAVLMLFIGGNGTLDLQPGQLNTGSPNFVARNRNHIAAEGFVVAVIDAANDFNDRPNRLQGRRLSLAHLADLRAVLRDLRKKYPDLPVWAVGHSRGTLSAAVSAAMSTEVTPEGVFPPSDGLVLLSSFTGDPANVTEDLSRIDIESIPAPALIVSHQGDVCAFTLPEDSRALTKRFVASERAKFRQFNGGSNPLSDPCDPARAARVLRHRPESGRRDHEVDQAPRGLRLARRRLRIP